LEKKVKQAAADTEPAWNNAGKEVGIQVWRMEKFKVKTVAKADVGTFYSGDSYIILHTYKAPPPSDALRWNVHFWLGAHTTQDEAGTAAYKTVELDDKLRGAPVQYREVQGYESEDFAKLFPNGIKILAGGVETGFTHVKPEEYKPRLLHIKGTKKSIAAVEVPLTGASLNEGDAFILDNGLQVYQWSGKSAGIFEKNKAATLARAIDEERAGKATVHVFAQGADGDFPWALLGGKPATIAAGTPDSAPNFVKKLFKVSDSSGPVKITKVDEGSIQKSHLKDDDVFIFDAGSVVYVWVGTKANDNEKKHALGFAQTYLAQEKRPAHLPIVRIFSGGENETFNAQFD
jgi:gelsolin